MHKFVQVSSIALGRGLLCGCAAILLSACGGNGGDAAAAGPVTQTAAEVLDSKTSAAARFDPRNPAVAEAATAAAIAGTSADETAGPSAESATPEPAPAAPAPQPAETAAMPVAPTAPAAGAAPAAAGTARIYVAGAGRAAVL